MNIEKATGQIKKQDPEGIAFVLDNYKELY